MAAAGTILVWVSDLCDVCAMLVGVDGLFMETHPNPAKGLSDATTMLPLDELKPLLEELIAIANASKGNPSKQR
ncbi:hypothetical protein DYB32_000905 [Aphanomyces invadans]|uniref:3-deoxy-8-phosphooctulonate synthase n=1 Tax=Aphanomyces invadans TaxID=157072 RepID=A0A3R6ZA92_9STRA|nr:hypothetical protein DYB32_000905 [Aphanomyces invadans]